MQKAVAEATAFCTFNEELKSMRLRAEQSENVTSAASIV